MNLDRITPIGFFRSRSSAVCLATAAFFLLFIACEREKPPLEKEVVRPVKVMKISSADKDADIELPGRVRASRRVDLAFQEVGGRLIELPIEGREGALVAKGDLLAKIDPTDFKVQLQNAQGQLKAAEAAVDLAESEYARVLKIQKQDPGAVSASMVDRRREKRNQTRGQVQSLKAAAADARNKLKYTALYAPFSGVIAKRFVDNYQEVKPKQPIASLQDVEHIEILADVPENLIAIASRNRDSIRVFTEFSTMPGRKFELQFKETATEADPATQTYQVTFQMKQPEGINALAGMTTKLIVSVKALKTATPDKIRIPAIAVVSDPQGQNYVWVLDLEQMIVHRRDVTVGPPTGSQDVLIDAGIKGDETIVTAGVLQLKEGQQVSIWKQ